MRRPFLAHVRGCGCRFTFFGHVALGRGSAVHLFRFICLATYDPDRFLAQLVTKQVWRGALILFAREPRRWRLSARWSRGCARAARTWGVRLVVRMVARMARRGSFLDSVPGGPSQDANRKKDVESSQGCVWPCRNGLRGGPSLATLRVCVLSFFDVLIVDGEWFGVSRSILLFGP